MGLKSTLGKPYASFIANSNKRWIRNPLRAQKSVFKSLIKSAKKTVFGADHNFKDISTYEDFKRHVPIVEYEQIKNYIERIKNGEKDVLWPGSPLYFCKTSGTTSGTKYIPYLLEI